MTAVLLGLAASITYGAADFLGGFATKRNNVLTVVLLSQIAGSALLIAVLPFFLEGVLTSEALVWGGLSGVAGAIGVAFFYQALSVGRMSVVAPITAVIAASIPVVFGLLTGERPSALAFAGVVVALIAVALVSSSAEENHEDDPTLPWHRRPGLVEAFAAGTSFGAFFILLSEPGDDSGLWPLLAARAASLGLIALAALYRRASLRPAPGTVRTIAAAGALDVSANLFYLFASRAGLLSLVAVLTSTYPATTVVLARVVLGERFTIPQSVGLGAAAAGITMIALG